MLIAAALAPSPPILVPELTGSHVGETAAVRDAAVATATQLGRLTRRWTVLGVGTRAETIGPTAVGTFRGFGVDVAVALSSSAGAAVDPMLPLPALIGAWLRETAAPDATLECRIVDVDATPDHCAQLGSALRTELDATAEPRGILVLADGATTLTPKAPGAYDDRAPGFQRELDAALAAGDSAALARLDPQLCAELGVSGRAAWQVLAAVFPDRPTRALTAYAGAPFGVGYHVGLWLP